LLSQPLRVPASHKQHSSWLRGLLWRTSVFARRE